MTNIDGREEQIVNGYRFMASKPVITERTLKRRMRNHQAVWSLTVDTRPWIDYQFDRVPINVPTLLYTDTGARSSPGNDRDINRAIDTLYCFPLSINHYYGGKLVMVQRYARRADCRFDVSYHPV